MDLENAYDTAESLAMLEVLVIYKFQLRYLLRLQLKSMGKESMIFEIIGRKLEIQFEVDVGLLHSCIMSPRLFNMIIDVLRQSIPR